MIFQSLRATRKGRWLRAVERQVSFEDPRALKCADESLRANRGFLLKALPNCPQALDFVDFSVRFDAELIKVGGFGSLKSVMSGGFGAGISTRLSEGEASC